MNLCLTFTVVLRVGLHRIKRDYGFPVLIKADIAFVSDPECKISGIEELPGSPGEAVDLMKASELVAETLGKDYFGHFLRDKRHERNAYHRQVTPSGRMRFLPAC